MFDVAVIGAGVVGCAVARYLTRYKLSVAVIEKAADIADGTSKANTGIVHSGHDAAVGSLKAKYNVEGNALMPQLCSELCVPYKNNGTIVLAFDEQQLAEAHRLVEQSVKNGVKGVRVLGAEELFKMEPNVSRKAVGALYAPTGGIVCPYMLTVALAENAAVNGAQFMLDTKVTALEKHGELWTVKTDKGEVQARAVVNCAGLFADEINNMVSGVKYSITARRGEYLILDKRHAGTFNAAIFQMPVKLASGHTKGIVIAPTVDGTIMLGPTAQDVQKNELQNTAEGFAQVLEGAALSWDSIPRGDFISCFAGLRAHPDCNDFVVGEAPDAKGFFNCLGIESPGLTSAPAIGTAMSDMVAAQLAAQPNPEFHAERNAPVPFREMTREQREQAIKDNPQHGVIVCRCETVTEAEVRAAIRGPVGARTLDAVKRRTRAGMGRCQSGFCSTRVLEILSEELGVPCEDITKSGSGSELLTGKLFDGEDK